MTSVRCLYCWTAEVLLFETIGQRSDVMKSKMAARGKFKTRNLFRLLLLLNVTFPLSSKICNLGIIWSNLGRVRLGSIRNKNNNIGIMQVSVCLGAILIPEYLDSILAILLPGAE